jgi:hypothetical protein
MLLRFAKIAGGLRAVIFQTSPLIATSVGLLSARTVAYSVGFFLANIASSWLPIIALLISVTGFFNAGSNSPECEAYYSQIRAIDESNRVAFAAYQLSLAPYLELLKAYNANVLRTSLRIAASFADKCTDICNYENSRCREDSHSSCGFGCYGCQRDAQTQYEIALNTIAGNPPSAPPPPPYQTYPACTAPNCPPGKKVWTQVLWASPNDRFIDAKGCYIIAYSQDAPTLPVKVEYNPFLPDLFVESRAISYYIVNGDRYRGLKDDDWKNLESSSGWDKGYWRSEFTDPECRGWRPGWSRPVK